jgi:hypothetical protein
MGPGRPVFFGCYEKSAVNIRKILFIMQPAQESISFIILNILILNF